MKPNINEMSGAQNGKKFQGQDPNWVLIAGGALLSTLSVHLGYRLKQVFDSKQPKNSSSGLKGMEADTETKPQHSGQLHTEPKMVQMTLPLTTASAPVYTNENGPTWSTSPDRLELTHKPFHNSTSPESPCISESGSDIYTKREVIQKLRQQLKRRDDMVLEMQDQLAELKSCLTSQRTRSDHLQSLLKGANRDLFDSEREIQRLRKAIANRNGFQDLECLDTGIGGNEVDKIEVMKREIGELKDLIEGKDYLLQNYKEQKSELSLKVKELQHRLDSQVANIF